MMGGVKTSRKMREALEVLLKTHHLAAFFQLLSEIGSVKAKAVWTRKALASLEECPLTAFDGQVLAYWLELARAHLLQEYYQVEKRQKQASYSQQAQEWAVLAAELWDLQSQIQQTLEQLRENSKRLCPSMPAKPPLYPSCGITEALLVLEPPYALALCATLRVEQRQEDLPSSFDASGRHQILLAQTVVRKVQEALAHPQGKRDWNQWDLYWLHYPPGRLEILGESIGLAAFFAFFSEVFALPLPADLAFTGRLEAVPVHSKKGVSIPGILQSFCLRSVGGVRQKLECLFWNRPYIHRIVLPKKNVEELPYLFSRHPHGIWWDGKYLRWPHSSRTLQVLGVRDLQEALDVVFGPKKIAFLYSKPKKALRVSAVFCLLLIGLLLGVLWQSLSSQCIRFERHFSLTYGGEALKKERHCLVYPTEKLEVQVTRGHLYLLILQGRRILPPLHFEAQTKPRVTFSLLQRFYDEDWFFVESGHPFSWQKLRQVVEYVEKTGRDLKRQNSIERGKPFGRPKVQVTLRFWQLFWPRKKVISMGQIEVHHLPVRLGLDEQRLSLDGSQCIVPARSRFSISLQRKGYLYIFERCQGKVRELSSYRLLGEEAFSSLSISLKRLRRDVQWFLVYRPRLLDESALSQLAQKLAQVVIQNQAERGLVWRSWRQSGESPLESLVRWQVATEYGALILDAKVHHLPFALRFLVQKKGQGAYEVFLPRQGWVRKGDRLKLRFFAYQRLFFCLYLWDSQGNLHRLWGPSLVQEGVGYLLPREGSYQVDDKPGIERFLVFYTTQEKIQLRKLEAWLAKPEAKKYLEKRQGVAPPYPLYVVGVQHK